MRVSQRQPLACQECSKQKRKCDKQIPCSRCRQRNLHCSREVVQIRKKGSQNEAEIEFLRSIVAELEETSPESLHSTIQRLKDRISQLHFGNDLLQPESLETSPERSSSATRGRKPIGFDSRNAASNEPNLSLPTAIEHLAWGRNSADCFPHRKCACPYQRHGEPFLSLNSQSFQFWGSALMSIVQVPDTAVAEKLVRFHICHLGWHHNCLHGQTFLEQCQVFWASGRCDHPLWIALYLSVLSSTICSIQNSDQVKASLGINSQSLQSPKTLFFNMTQALYSSDFLQNISFHALQAIVISTEAAHILGLSQLNATLFNAAVRIAECLGVHKIKDHPTSSAQTEEQWVERVEREVGKRVWCQMVIQDHFAIPFTDTYSISPNHFSTGVPLNADDHDLFGMPTNIPTVSSFARVLAKLAALMPELADGLGPMRQRKPLHEQYLHVMRTDQKMKAIVKDIPSFLLRPDKEKDAQVPWLPIARRSFAITTAEKIIMVHRPFLFHAFVSRLYSYTRRTCVAAATTILREHAKLTEDDNPSIWTHTAFCITAAVILCFELNATSDTPTTTTETYKAAITAARTRLATREGDVLAHRGVALIDTIFYSEDSTPNTDNLIDFNRACAQFSTLTLKSTSDELPLYGILGDSVEDRIENYDHLKRGTEVDFEFDTWFNGIFYGVGG